ncbi:MAG: CoA pyrophosphatase [Dehalococcoidales bacterium]|nr:CoA pyrophosphatase [Dehalococcoidales bacterium]
MRSPPGWKPWPVRFMETIEHRLKQYLAWRQVHHIVDDCRVPSAVLLPLYRKEGQLHLLFTKRTEKVSTHKGQVSFPGGTYCSCDKTLAETALRESCEEIGLFPRDVEVMGRLDDNCSNASNYTISPFVGSIPYPYEFKLNHDEAERIIEVPIPALLEHSHIRQDVEIICGKTVATYFYHYGSDIIWGATARILHQFLDIFAGLGEGQESKVA